MSSNEEAKRAELTKCQLKKRIKENHEMLRRKDLSSFKLTQTLKLATNISCASLDTMSLRSTNSSGSGPITAWEHAWTLNNSRPSTSRHSSSTNSLTSQSSKKSTSEGRENYSLTSSELKLNLRQERPSIKQITDACFLRSNYGLLVAEPSKHRVQVFSNKRHTLLVTITDNTKHCKLSESLSLACADDRFTPTSISETDHEDVVAVCSQNTVVYVRVDGGVTEMEAQTRLKERACLRTVECISNGRMIVSETGPKPFLGAYDLCGKMVREFKSLRDLLIQPSSISWSHHHHIAAVVDVGLKSILFLDKDGRLLNTFEGKRGTYERISSLQASTLSMPTGAAWCNPHHLIVADNMENKLVTLDLRNLTSEVSVQSGLMDPVVVACNDRGNRLLVTEERKKILNSDIQKIDRLKVKDTQKCMMEKDAFALKMFQRHGMSNHSASNGLFVD